MRPIDADALYEELRYMPYDNILEGTIGHERPLRAIKNAPTVTGWVSAKDKLPGRKGLYLCKTQSADGASYFDLCIWYRDGWKCKRKVLYWMKIPETPEEVIGDD